MLRMYTPEGVAVPLSSYEDLCIVHEQNGEDTLSFIQNVESDDYKKLYEECKIDYGDNEWLIKKIDDDKIECDLDFDFLKTQLYKDFRSETKTLTEVLTSQLPNGWTIEGANTVSIRRTIEFDFCTDYDIVYECMHTYKVYFVWEIKNKKLLVCSQGNMQTSGEYLTSELNLKSISYKGDTKEFATRLYAFGKDGMTLENAIVNEEEYGLQYIDNNQYASKTVVCYLSDERYTNPTSLYEDAQKKLLSFANPVKSYECEVTDLAKISTDYNFLDFKMHKKVTLIDTDRGIKVEHQIVKYVEYPDTPEDNKITLSCVPDTVASKMEQITNTINDETNKITTDYNERLMMVSSLLTGAFGSYPYTYNGELLMMDNPDPALAQIVWRWNKNGFGKSSTGIEGPYTTAITFDDQFITNIIDAMTIRGALIEAGSIQAGSINQSYTDDVLTSAFNAADGLVKFETNRINNYLSNNDSTGQLDVINNELLKIIQDIDGLKLRYDSSYYGGINYMFNSSGLNGLSDDWEYTGVVTTQNDTDVHNYTVADCCFVMSAGSTLKQRLTNLVLGSSYNVSMKIKKTSEFTSKCVITYNGGLTKTLFELRTDKVGWTEYSTVIENVTVNELEVSFTTNGDSLFIADIMVNEGTDKKSWTPAPNEIYTDEVKIDKNGVKVSNTASSQTTVMTRNEFAGYYKDELTFTLNKDETRMKKTFVDGELTVKTTKAIPFDNDGEVGLNIVVMD